MITIKDDNEYVLIFNLNIFESVYGYPSEEGYVLDISLGDKHPGAILHFRDQERAEKELLQSGLVE